MTCDDIMVLLIFKVVIKTCIRHLGPPLVLKNLRKALLLLPAIPVFL